MDMWEMQDECPRCGVPARTPCKNLRNGGEPQWPHQERIRLVEHMTPAELRNHERRQRQGRSKRPQQRSTTA